MSDLFDKARAAKNPEAALKAATEISDAVSEDLAIKAGFSDIDSLAERLAARRLERDRAETPNPVKVVIDTPGPTITVEATGVLDDVTAKAMEIYREIVKDWPRPKDGIAAGSGFHTERSWE